MPPRLPLSGSVELCSHATSISSTPHTRTSPLELALRTCKAASRSFSTSPQRNSTLPAARYKFYQWLKRDGVDLAHHTPGQQNYLRDRTGNPSSNLPFPSNPAFPSQPVLCEKSRKIIHSRVMDHKEPIMVVSADLGVDHRRVAAVVRMKEVEKEWIRTGKKLATPYARAVMDMLPLHTVANKSGLENPFSILTINEAEKMIEEAEEKGEEHPYLWKGPDGKIYMSDDDNEVEAEDVTEEKQMIELSIDGNPVHHDFEPINDIHVHGHTMQQLFVSTSESRHFTREDAATAFGEHILSADQRMPHKELVKFYRRIQQGEDESSSREKFLEGARAAQEADVRRDASKKEWEKRLTTVVPTDRAEFRFKKMAAEDSGTDGRSRRGIGWRYGAPSEDRKKDQVKHPVKYE